ncbi:hypothetical protein KKG36_02115, partial [Patescibacteria group bacterium]|nr:hypothetical protein [Patescibacteria group bacterium]
MKCANCGREKEVTTRDLIFALMVDLGGARTNFDFKRCSCPKGIKIPVYWKANDITEEEAEEMGELELKTWKLHHTPRMRDCVTLNYGYFVTKDGKVICES